jgi:glycosyltransferase involved in cell wall biosynthesis
MSAHPPARLIMTADAVGGVWSYATTLANGLAAADCEVHLVTMGPPPSVHQTAAIAAPNVHLVVTDLALEWQDPAGNDINHSRALLLELEERLQPDLVHLNGYREAAFDWRTPVLVAAHSCVNSWALACNDSNFLAEPQWKRYSAAVADGLDAAQAWVSPTQSFRSVIRKLYRPGSGGNAIWNGVASPDDVSQKEDFILGAGRMWDRAKNLPALAEAACGLDWPVLVAGPSVPGSDAPPGIEMLGALSNQALRRIMQRAAIFASPALYEPFGLSVLEAAAAGCALVLSDIPTFRELWDGAALFVAPHDAKALLHELALLCADDCRRRRLQEGARERAKTYSVERMIESYRALYSDLLRPASEPAPNRIAGAYA